MSEEEELEINEPKSVEEQLSTENVKPTTLNKNGKPRKKLSPEHLDKLAAAREKSNQVRKKMVVKKLEDKAEKIKKENNLVMPEPKPEPEVFEYEEEIPKEKPKPKEKAKSKKKTKIIVEQSSDDSDQFEPNDNVVFVKRVSRKKKPPEPPPPAPPQYAMEEPPEPPPPPHREPKMLSANQIMMRDTYHNMFSGGFLKNNGLPRRY
tara:strand:+ start:602 stop:1219 length:618 start_codon:yes stop_codon:yes gene_type:complete